MKDLLKPIFFAIAFLTVLGVTPGRAEQFNLTFVSMSGSDANNCAYGSPCRRLDRAVAMTANEGRITCLGAGYDDLAVTVTRQMSVSCEGGSVRFFVVKLTGGTAHIHGLNVSGADGLTQSVWLTGTGSVVLNGLKVNGVGAYYGVGQGISVVPDGPLNVTIANSVISRSGYSSVGAGVLVKPEPGGSARVVLDRTVVSGNVFGVAIDGSGSTAGINTTIKDSTISSNTQDGIVATTSSGGAPIGVFVTGSASSNNAIGIRSIGSSVTVRVESSKVTGNGTGVASLSGGALLSAGNNYVQANGNNGSFTGSMAAQ